MPFLNKLVLLNLIIAAGFTLATANPVTFIKKHQYFDAIEAWEKEASGPAVDDNKLRALKGQAIAYQKLGDLYMHFHRFSSELFNEYYERMGDLNPSPSLTFYKAQMEYYNGNYQLAIKLLETVIRDRNSQPKFRDLAKVYRHFSLNQIHKKRGHFNMQSSFPSVTWQVHELDDSKTMPIGIATTDIRSHRNKLRILIRQNGTNERDLKTTLEHMLKNGDEPEFSIHEGKLTQINFYDPMLLETLAHAFYWLAASRYQTLEQTEGKYPELARKFNTGFSLGEIYYRLGKYSQALQYLQKDKTPEARLYEAKIAFDSGDKNSARKMLNDLEGASTDPSFQRDLGYFYFQSGISNRKALQFTQRALRKKKSSEYYQKYANILFAIGKKQEALDTFTKGYKIQYRNSVIHNDPEYMIDYAKAIFVATKMRYDEVVETLYHIQKAYPATRCLHYTMQGIAAANTNTFGSEKIFRKGG